MDQNFLEGGWLGSLDKAALREPLKPKDNNGFVASSNGYDFNYECASNEKQSQSGSKTNSNYIQMIDKSVLREIYDTYSFRGGGFGYRRPGMTVEGFRAVVVDAKLFGKDDIKARREAELITSAILSKSTTNLDFDQFIRALSKLGKRIPWSKIKGEIAEATHLSSEEKVFVTICQTLKGSDYERSPIETSQSPLKERMTSGRPYFSSPKSERERRNSMFKHAAKKNPLCSLIEKNQKAFQVLFTHYIHRETGNSAHDSKYSSISGISTNELRKFAQDFGIFPDFMQLEDLRETMLDVTSTSDILSTPGSAATGNYSLITTCEQFNICLIMIAYYAFGEQPIKAFEEVEEVDPNEATERLLSLFRRMNFMREKRPAPPMPVNFVRFKDLENCTPSGSTPVRKRQVSRPNSPQSSAERVRRGFNASRILFGTDSEVITSEQGVATNSISRKLEKQLLGSSEETPVSEKDHTPVNDWHSSYSSSDRMSRISTVKERLSALSKSSVSPDTFTPSESKENYAPSSAGIATADMPLINGTQSAEKNTPTFPLIGRSQPFAKTACNLSNTWMNEDNDDIPQRSEKKVSKGAGRLQIGKTPPLSILPCGSESDVNNQQTVEQSELQHLTNEVREANRCLEKATADLELSPFLTDDYKLSPGEPLFDDLDLLSEMFPSSHKREGDESFHTVTPSLYLRSFSKKETSDKRGNSSKDLRTSDQEACIMQLLSSFGKEQTRDSSLDVQEPKKRTYVKLRSIWSQIFVLILQMVIMLLFFVAYAYTFGMVGYDPVVDEPFLS
ncbi:hypothetical protein GpartN1_g4899.t1 [Galdieria partita]|uniref:Uncharacterized protein n=1 Tax=Galdieria partita TaxID=83374 RepID=A0A9C7PY80_9RHOD|nr:hypothetical protein GpartN1_g4899.t1 [Galdieria partita]